MGTAYGAVIRFTTSVMITAPTVITGIATSITSTDATLEGDIPFDGGSSVTVRGFVYSMSSTDLEIGETGVINEEEISTETGSFSKGITGLTPSTTYHYKSYAKNGVGTAYGAVVSFTTSVMITAPTVITGTATSITSTDATLDGDIPFDGGSSVTIRGFVYSMSSTDLEIGETGVINEVVIGAETGIFSKDITGLTVAAQCYYRAYATNDIGTSYGDVKSFRTSAILPTVITGTATSITSTDATLEGDILSDGGSSVTVRGFVYSMSSTGLEIGETGVINEVVIGAETGVFSKDITGLTVAAQCYYRAYATNDIGTSYGDVKIFTTSAILPTVISPNPTRGILNVVIDEKTDYRLLNTRGQIIKEGTLSKGKSKINLGYLPKGVYFLNLRNNKGNLTKKVVRN